MLIDVSKITFEEDEYYKVEYYPLWGKAQRPDVIRLVVQYKDREYSQFFKKMIYKFIVILSNDPDNITVGGKFTISDKARMYRILEKI